jgi:hypothetical protein
MICTVAVWLFVWAMVRSTEGGSWFASGKLHASVHCNVLEFVKVWYSGPSEFACFGVDVTFYPSEGVVSLECAVAEEFVCGAPKVCVFAPEPGFSCYVHVPQSVNDRFVIYEEAHLSIIRFLDGEDAVQGRDELGPGARQWPV